MKPDLERLRRFSLTMGLLVFTYAAAGISLRDDATVAPFGIPFVIERTEFLPIGLAVGSAYSAFRFWYFGVALSASPFTRRMTLLRRYRAEDDVRGRLPRAIEKLPILGVYLAGYRLLCLDLVETSDIPAI